MEAPYDADLSDTLMRHRFIRRLVGIEVQDTILATKKNIEDVGLRTLADLRQLSHNVADYSPDLQADNRELKQYLFDNFYRHYRVVRMATKADRLLTGLFQAYIEQPLQLPQETLQGAKNNPGELLRLCATISPV